MHWGTLFPRDSTDAYTTRQGNVHYVYHNTVVTVAIPYGCSASKAPGECSLDQKGAEEVCELTSGSIFARVDRV